MTTRQHNEVARIVHRFGRAIVRPLDREQIAVEVVGDPEVEVKVDAKDVDQRRPRFRLVLDEHGLVLRREPLGEVEPLAPRMGRPVTTGALDERVVAALKEQGAWCSSALIADRLDENGRHGVAASLRRLYLAGRVDSRGLSRDKVWRAVT